MGQFADLLDYAGRRVVVTGCASGIGAALVGQLSEMGADVVGLDLRPPALALNEFHSVDLSDPASVYAEPARRDAYLKMYGNICYDTRDQYVNFPWSSEQK